VTGPGPGLFVASHPCLFFDYFRVPYSVADGAAPAGGPLAVMRAAATPDRTLTWPTCPPGAAAFHELEGVRFFASVASDETARKWLRDGDWNQAEPILDGSGGRAGSVWRDGGGSVFLPFDPGSAIEAYWSESYLSTGEPGPSRRLKQAAMRGYYRVRPVLPRRVQISLRRAFAVVQARATFPRWPFETALHDFYRLLFRLAGEVAGEPVPYLAPWPSPYTWTLVLTHDVEMTPGWEHMHLLRDIELERGYRSAWYLVPERDYRVDDQVVRELGERGFEVGVHGLHHDGRDLESRAVLEERLPAIRRWAERWSAVGFRSPATHRDWELMPLLGFDYDSSSFDTDPFEPQSGGSCTWLPFFNRDLVELPITLTMDHTAFVILRRDESLWIEKADFLRERGGAAVLITHPDYMLDPARLDAYRRFLDRYADDDAMWRALPRDVSAWWRRRAASSLDRAGEGWRIVGPAAGDGVVALADR
jgi:peptidoglycan/xylan/chitin deacetylase (PgdA/CDA1 family)